MKLLPLPLLRASFAFLDCSSCAVSRLWSRAAFLAARDATRSCDPPARDIGEPLVGVESSSLTAAFCAMRAALRRAFLFWVALFPWPGGTGGGTPTEPPLASGHTPS